MFATFNARRGREGWELVSAPIKQGQSKFLIRIGLPGRMGKQAAKRAARFLSAAADGVEFYRGRLQLLRRFGDVGRLRVILEAV